jgi:hypothetical protein
VAAPSSAGNLWSPLPASITSPFGVAIDPSSGNLYVTVIDVVMIVAGQ